MLAALLSGCGGGGGSEPPFAPSTPDPSIPVGTVLTFAWGDSSQPVGGATVVVAGRTYTTGGDGQVVLQEQVAAHSPVDVVGPNVLDRLTLLRSATATRFTLWPKTHETGLNQHFTATIVYTSTADPPSPSEGSR